MLRRVGMYILIDSTLRVNFKVDSACMPYDSTNLATQDGCWIIPRVWFIIVANDTRIERKCGRIESEHGNNEQW